MSNRQWGAIIGNAIPVPMIQRVMGRVLPAAGFYEELPDLWGPVPNKCSIFHMGYAVIVCLYMSQCT